VEPHRPAVGEHRTVCVLDSELTNDDDVTLRRVMRTHEKAEGPGAKRPGPCPICARLRSRQKTRPVPSAPVHLEKVAVGVATIGDELRLRGQSPQAVTAGSHRRKLASARAPETSVDATSTWACPRPILKHTRHMRHVSSASDSSGVKARVGPCRRPPHQRFIPRRDAATRRRRCRIVYPWPAVPFAF
jgi:hypothetical protein